MAFGLVSSRLYVFILPAASVTSTYTCMCGLVHSTFETTPVAVMVLVLSYSVSNPWWATAGTVTYATASAVTMRPHVVLMSNLLESEQRTRRTAHCHLPTGGAPPAMPGEPGFK